MGIAELFSKFVKLDCRGGGWDILSQICHRIFAVRCLAKEKDFLYNGWVFRTKRGFSRCLNTV